MSGHDTPLRPENMRRLAAERVGNERLRGNLARATRTSLDKRARVVAERDDWEASRLVMHEIKRGVIEHLPAWLERFEERATANGMRVSFARTADDACRVIRTIIGTRTGPVIVKSKSMTTEEIGLNHALARAGIEVLETDLGEYIVQMAGQMPSHITAPALHLSREEIGRLFADNLGIPYTSEPAELTAIARRVLREKFLAAEVGISGVNAAVADTGAICVVENEGNARLSTTLPRLHIAVMGIEKLLPDTASLLHLLGMLARSATGQRISSYTSIITGPRRDGELDGPDELHVVIIDNGRSALLADPELREALACIRCGACLNVCPVFQTIGGHGYGAVYPGPIGSVITPVFEGLERARELPFASSLCGACAEVCPVRIALPRHLLRHRASIVRDAAPILERFIMRAFARVMAHPRLYGAVTRCAAFLAPLVAEGKGTLPVPLWSRARDFPPPAASRFRDLWKEDRHGRA